TNLLKAEVMISFPTMDAAYKSALDSHLLVSHGISKKGGPKARKNSPKSDRICRVLVKIDPMSRIKNKKHKLMRSKGEIIDAISNFLKCPY
ncbi:unnamed protein product, partial [marine sediment metagenome]